MMLTRKEFLSLSGRAAASAAAYRAFPSLTRPSFAQDLLSSDAVRKIHKYIEDHKEEHVAQFQADLRQPSVSIIDHLQKKGYGDIEVRQLGGGDEWSQTSVKEPAVQAVLSVYKHYGVNSMVWPRSAGSSPQWEYTRKLGLPAASGGLGHGGRAHSDDEYIVIEGNDKVAGIVKSEQSIVDILFTYAAYPEPARRPTS